MKNRLKLIFVLLLVLVSTPTTSAEAPVILVFGDSLSAAYGLPQDKGWAALLQQRLRAHKFPHRVVNASVSGETTSGGRTRIAHALARHRPAWVLLELGANDGMRGTALSVVQTNLNEIARAVSKAPARLVIIGVRLPPNYGASYTEKFAATFDSVARARRAALVPFLLDGFADRRDLFQSDGLHPTAAAQQLMLDNVWKVLAPLLGEVGTRR